MTDPRASQIAAIELLAAREDIRRMTSARSSPDFEQPLQLLRSGLYYELGVQIPRLQLREVEDLPAGHFAARIGDERTQTWPLLGPDQFVVNASAAVLPGEAIAEARDPEWGTAWSVIEGADARARLSEIGYLTWNALEYMVLILAAQLRQQAASFVTLELVERELDRVATRYPNLVELCRARFEPGQIHATLQGLVAERVSIRDLPTILEQLVDFDRIVANDIENIILDPRLPVRAEDITRPPSIRELVDYVRSRLASSLTHTHLRGSNTLVVYLLDPTIEAHLEAQRRRQQPPDPAIARGLIEALSAELGDAASSTVILTTSYVRHSVRAIIADAFPWLAVFAYQELDSTTNIQPIGRISLP